MKLRVPDGLLYSKGSESLAKARDKMVSNQEKGMTGKRVNRPSDDPSGMMRLIDLKSKDRRDEAVMQNLEFAQGYLNLTDASLSELGEVITRTKELALQMSSSTNFSDDARQAVSKEVDQLFLRAVQIGNTRFGDRYVFGGFQTDRPPFDENGNYFGDAGQIQMEVGRGQTVSVNIAGVQPFYGTDQIPSLSEELRRDPKMRQVPTLDGDLRSPASIEAMNLGVDADSDPEAMAQIAAKAGVNLFSAIKGFSQALKDGNRSAVNTAIDDMEKGFKQVLASRSTVGARQNIVNLSNESLDLSRANSASQISSTEDADVLQVYSDLGKNENVLKASLEMNRKLLTPSLLDFLK